MNERIVENPNQVISGFGNKIKSIGEQFITITSEKLEENYIDLLKNSSQGLVTFIDDDAKSEVYTRLKPIFDAKGVKCTIAVSSDRFDIQGYLTKSQILELQNNGWEIASHGKTHTPIADKTYQEQEEELKISLETLKNNGFNVESIVYPYGQNNSDTRKLTKKYYKCGVQVGGPYDGENYIPVIQLALYRTALGSYTSVGKDTLEYYKSVVDKAKNNKCWVIFMTHIADTDSVQEGYLRDTVQYCLDTNVPVVTLSEGLKKFGNVVQFGDNYENQANSFVIGANYKLNNGSFICYGNNAISLNSLPSELPDKHLIYSTFNGSYASIESNNVPLKKPGLLITESVNTAGYRKQTYKIYESDIVYTRFSYYNNTWSQWKLEKIDLGQNNITLDMKPSSFADRTLKYQTTSTSYATTNNYPEGKAGMLIVESFDKGYAKQTYKIYESNNTYVRYSLYSSDSWGEWEKIYKGVKTKRISASWGTLQPNEGKTVNVDVSDLGTFKATEGVVFNVIESTTPINYLGVFFRANFKGATNISVTAYNCSDNAVVLDGKDCKITILPD